MDWTNAKKQLTQWNFKILYMIFNAVNATKLNIQVCTREAHNIQKITHDGITAFMMYKILNLTKDFKYLTMDNDDTFDYFYDEQMIL